MKVSFFELVFKTLEEDYMIITLMFLLLFFRLLFFKLGLPLDN